MYIYIYFNVYFFFDKGIFHVHVQREHLTDAKCNGWTVEL